MIVMLLHSTLNIVPVQELWRRFLPSTSEWDQDQCFGDTFLSIATISPIVTTRTSDGLRAARVSNLDVSKLSTRLLSVTAQILFTLAKTPVTGEVFH